MKGVYMGKKLSYNIKDFIIITCEPKCKMFSDLKENLVYSFKSKDGNIFANFLWHRSKSKGYCGDFANFEVRAMVGDTGVLHQHFPLWRVTDEIPSASSMINALINILARGKYQE